MSESKYEPLHLHLKNRGASPIVMSLMEIEQVLGDRLPTSAREHRAWWSNESTGTRHVQSKAWMNAGYRAELAPDRRSVTFIRT